MIAFDDKNVVGETSEDDPRAARRSGKAGRDPSDPRSPFHRDRDRIFYSAEFARLQGVTQVTTTDSIAVHNRYTHSHKVEGAARSIVLHLRQQNDGIDVDEDVVMAAALAHDIGHAPFGHTGEVALHAVVTCDKHRRHDSRSRTKKARRDPDDGSTEPVCDCKLMDGFEGNAQSLRIAAILAVKSTGDLDDGPSLGMDLTRRVLAATAKYPWTRGANIQKLKKWGAYDCDASVLEWVQGAVDGEAASLEAQVMDRADDIAYAVHDLEDFYKSGAIPLWEVDVDPKFLSGFFDYVRESFEEESPLHRLEEEFKRYKQTQSATSDQPDQRRTGPKIPKDDFPLLSELESFVGQFPKARYVDDAKGRARFAAFRSSLIQLFVEDLTIENGEELRFRTETSDLFIEFVKQLSWYYVIENPELSVIQAGQTAIIETCFTYFYGKARGLWVAEDGAALKPRPHDVRSFPSRFLDYVKIGFAQVEGGQSKYLASQVIARAVVDYLCSLTDDQVYALAGQINGDLRFTTPRAFSLA